MKNYLEQLRMSVVNSVLGYTNSTIVSAETDIQIKDNKVIDTSGDTVKYFASTTVGAIIKMAGWAKEENNGIFKVASKASDGSWVRLDMPLKDELSVDSPGVTIYKTPRSITVTGVKLGTTEVLGGLDVTNPAVLAGADLKVTALNTVSSFATLSTDTAGDSVVVYWADLTKG